MIVVCGEKRARPASPGFRSQAAKTQTQNFVVLGARPGELGEGDPDVEQAHGRAECGRPPAPEELAGISAGIREL